MYIDKPKGMEYSELIGKRVRITHYFMGDIASVSEGVIDSSIGSMITMTLLNGEGLVESKPHRKGSKTEIWVDD